MDYFFDHFDQHQPVEIWLPTTQGLLCNESGKFFLVPPQKTNGFYQQEKIHHMEYYEKIQVQCQQCLKTTVLDIDNRNCPECGSSDLKKVGFSIIQATIFSNIHDIESKDENCSPKRENDNNNPSINHSDKEYSPVNRIPL